MGPLTKSGVQQSHYLGPPPVLAETRFARRIGDLTQAQTFFSPRARFRSSFGHEESGAAASIFF